MRVRSRVALVVVGLVVVGVGSAASLLACGSSSPRRTATQAGAQPGAEAGTGTGTG